MATLSSLPPEILDLIAKQVQNAEIFSLRLVSKFVANAIENETMDRFFTSRHYLNLPVSYVNLIQVAKSRVGRRLRDITIQTVGSSVEREFEKHYPITPEESASVAVLEREWKHDGISDTGFYGQSRRTQSLEDPMTKGEHFRLIVQAFSNLHDAGIVPSITIEAYPSTVFVGERKTTLPVAYGTARVMGLSERKCRTSGFITDISDMVLFAITEANLPISELHLRSCVGEASFGQPALSLLRFTTQSPVWSQLKSLSISIDSLRREHITSLEGCFGLLSSLTSLNLAFRVLTVEDSRMLARWLQNSKLEELGLFKGCLVFQGSFTTESLLALLLPFKETLRSLKLSDRYITKEPWHKTLPIIANSLDLHHLNIWRLTQQRESMKDALYDFGDRREWRGDVKQVREGVEEYVRTQMKIGDDTNTAFPICH